MKEKELMQLKLENEASLLTSELNSLKDIAVIQYRKRPKTPAGEVDNILKDKIKGIMSEASFKQDFKLLVSMAQDLDAVIIDTAAEITSTFAKKWIME